MCGLNVEKVDSLVIIGGLRNFLNEVLNLEHGEGNVVKDFFEVDFVKIGTGFDDFDIFIHFSNSAYEPSLSFQQKF